MPKDAQERARVRSLSYLIACEIHPLNNLRVLQHLKRALGQSEDQVNAWYRHWIADGLAKLEAELASSKGRFCHGDTPTMADCCLVPQIFNAKRYQSDLLRIRNHARIRRVHEAGGLRPRATVQAARRRVTERPWRSSSAIAGYHPGTQPDYNFPALRLDAEARPTQPLVLPPQTISEITGPIFGCDDVKPTDHDLTQQHKGEPIGERIIVTGRVLDENGKPVPHTLVEIWQANAAGRYPHRTDQHDAPLDPNFTGAGRTVTDAEGRYRFITIRPGEYPWRNHYNAWRPGAHPFLAVRPGLPHAPGDADVFPGRSAADLRPDVQLHADERARQRLVSAFDWETHHPRAGARLPLRHRAARAATQTPMENDAMSLHATASQTVGPYLHIGLDWLTTETSPAAASRASASRSGPRRSTATAAA